MEKHSPYKRRSGLPRSKCKYKVLGFLSGYFISIRKRKKSYKGLYLLDWKGCYGSLKKDINFLN